MIYISHVKSLRDLDDCETGCRVELNDILSIDVGFGKSIWIGGKLVWGKRSLICYSYSLRFWR